VNLTARLGITTEHVLDVWVRGPMHAHVEREHNGATRGETLGAACEELGRGLAEALSSGAMGPLALWVRREAPAELSIRDLCALVEGFFEVPRRAAVELGDAALADAVGGRAVAALSAVAEAAVARARDRQRPRAPADLDDVAAVLTDTLLSTHPDGAVHYVSAGITETTGLTVQEVRADPSALERVVLPEDRPARRKLLDRARTSTRPVEAVYRVRHQTTGQTRWVLHRITGVRQGGALARLDGLLVDITERRELERRLDQSLHLRRLGQLAGGIAHDFNNLLVSILGYADLLLVRTAPGSREGNALELITAAAERGAELTERLLTFARGSVSSQKENTRLERVIRDTMALLAPSVPKSIRIELVEEPGVPVVVADSAQVGEAVLNLVLNAVQACDRGRGGEVRVTLRPATEAETSAIGAPTGCTVVVQDDGPGMTPDVLKRVFEPLFTTREDGTGLGCAMAYGVALDHGGTLQVESQPGHGATFRFVLPGAPADAVPVRRGRKLLKTPVARVRGAQHILVADDEPSVRSLLVDVLQGAGYRVTAVASGVEALDAVSAQDADFDLVILDVMMRPLDGTEAFRGIRERRPRLPILFCTGYSDAARVADPSALREAPIITKPFRPAELVQRARAAMDKTRRRR